MRRSVLALAAIAAVSADASAKGFAMGTPPSEFDVGQGMAGGREPLTQVLAGLSWASLFWKPAHFDFTFGYVGQFQAAPANGPPVAFRTIAPTATSRTLYFGGAYLALARTIYNRKHVRTWFSARGELLGGQYEGRELPVLGGAVRLSTELFDVGHFFAGDHSGFLAMSGSVAIGFYVEAEHRDVPDALGPSALSTGISVRLPFTFVAVK